MIILKCVQVLNDGYIKRFVKTFTNEQDADAYEKEFMKDKRFYRESEINRYSSFDTVSVEDCKNNSISSFAEILSLQRVLNCDEYLRRSEIIDLVNAIIDTRKGDTDGTEN